MNFGKLCKTKIWWKCKALLYGYKQLHCSCKNRWYLQRYCKRFEKETDTSNYEIYRPLSIGKKLKSDWINERLIRWTNHEKIC